jgi:hypothetical protein
VGLGEQLGQDDVLSVSIRQAKGKVTYSSIIPDIKSQVKLICFVDRVDRSLFVPKTDLSAHSFRLWTGLLLDRDIMADTAEFTLKSDSRGIIRTGSNRVDGSTTLWVGVLTISLNQIYRVVGRTWWLSE